MALCFWTNYAIFPPLLHMLRHLRKWELFRQRINKIVRRIFQLEGTASAKNLVRFSYIN